MTHLNDSDPDDTGDSAMKVKVKYLTPLKDVTKKSEEYFEIKPSATINNLAQEIITRYGAPFEDYLVAPGEGTFTTKKISIGIQRDGLIGTKTIGFLKGFETPLKDQDLVLFYPPYA